MKRKLSPFRQRFVEEYLIDLNGAAAYKRAGGARKAAAAAASRLLRIVNVQRAISEGQAKIRKKNDGLAQRVIDELILIGFADIKDYLDIDEDTGAIRAKGFKKMKGNSSRAIMSVIENRTIREDAAGKDSIVNSRIEFKMHPKMAALDGLCKHLGLFEKDNQQKNIVAYVVKYADADEGDQ